MHESQTISDLSAEARCSPASIETTKRLADVVLVLSEQQMANDIKYPATTVKAALKKAGLEPVKFIRFKVGAVAL